MTEKLVCVHCGSKDFYFDSYEENVRVIISKGEKIKYSIKVPLDFLNYWYCNKCHKHATEEQCEILANLFSEDSHPQWISFEEL
jgi:ATP sulfurylase